MTHVVLTDLVNLHDLNEMVEQRYVDVQVHPTLPLTIYNYAKQCMMDRVWNDVTLQTRGLIVENYTGRVIARGMSKFWNVGQPEAKTYPLDTPVMVSPKEDGSLGICWQYHGYFGVATRGSFMSEQAQHATDLLNTDEYEWLRKATARESGSHTPVVEVVYAENRIVLDYRGRDELIPLGEVDMDGLVSRRYIKGTPYDFLFQCEPMTYGEALAMKIPDDAEGWVIDFLDDAGRVVDHQKLKGEIYKMLHAILTNTSARRIWAQMAARACHQWITKPKDWAMHLGQDPADFVRVDVSKPLAETLGDVPDEFLEWVETKVVEIEANVERHLAAMRYDFSWLKAFEGRERFEEGRGILEFNEINRSIRDNDERHMILRAWREAYPDGHDLPFMSGDE